MKKLTFLILAIGLLISPFYIQAQTSTISKSTEVETINNQKFYVHTVQPKETLYAISKAYNVSTDDIIGFNPTITNGLTSGQTIKIPAVNTPKSNPSSQTTAPPLEISREKSKEIVTINNESYYIHT